METKKYNDENHFIKDELPISFKNSKNKVLFKELKETTDEKEKEKIRQKLILGNLKLVPYMVSSLCCQEEYEMMEEVCYEKLIIAVDNYNPDLGVSFSRYTCDILARIIFKKSDNIFSKENKTWSDKFYICKNIVEEKYGKSLEEDFSLVSEISELMVTKGYIDKKFVDSNSQRILMMYDEQISSYEFKYTQNFLENLEYESLQEEIYKAILMLTDKEKYIILSRVGLIFPEKTLIELSKEFGVSHQRIFQQEKRILTKLRKLIEEEQFEVYLENEVIPTYQISHSGVYKSTDQFKIR